MAFVTGYRNWNYNWDTKIKQIGTSKAISPKTEGKEKFYKPIPHLFNPFSQIQDIKASAYREG